MATKIPDKLTKLVCDYCHKYLSVTPVRMLPDKRIKCGRCSNDADREEYFELPVNEYCFPCVNRFDGCEKLLVPSEVAYHEKSCQSGRNVCPICLPDDEEIPSFMMIKHFQEKHIENLLEANKFSMDMEESLPIEKWFLYELKNRLFFINCSLNESNISVNVTYLGLSRESERITQRFTLKNENYSTDTEEKLCLPHKPNAAGSTVDRSIFNPKAPIAFYFQIHFFISETAVTKQYRDDAMWSLTSTLIGKRNEERKNASLTEADFPEDDLIKSRYIFLDDCEDKTLSMGFTFNFCIRNTQRIFLRCFKCAELYEFVTKNDGSGYSYNFVIIFGGIEEAFLICKFCDIHRRNLGLPESHTTMNFMQLKSFVTIKLFCMWNCNVIIPIDKVLEHEFTCDKQPSRLCPLEMCSMKGKLNEIQGHFKEHSPEYLLTYNSFIDVGLDPSKSPIKNFLLVRNAFVFVELTWTLPLWNMKFRLCGKKDTFAGMKLKAVVTNNKNIFILAEHPQPIEFYHMNKVAIKCFLEK